MKSLNYLLLAGLLLGLTACPYLDPPPPVAPLAAAKTQKTSFKANCRLKNYYQDANNGYTYTYDAEGKLLRQRNLSNEFGYDYEYDANGFLVKRYVFYGEGLTFPDRTFEYDATGELKAMDPYGPTANREFDGAGRISKITYQARNGTTNTVTYAYNAAGNLIEEIRTGNFCDGAAVCTSTFRYDGNGNPTLWETRSAEFGTRRTEWTYDTNPNPENLLPDFKGWPSKRPLNNVIKKTSKSDAFTRNGFMFPAQETTNTYEYTYNAQGYPVQVKNVYVYTSSRSEQNFTRTNTYANEYENCPVP